MKVRPVVFWLVLVQAFFSPSLVQGAAGVSAGGALVADASARPMLSEPPPVLISEFMADNSKTLRDEDGDSSDWIELFNSQDTAVSLDRWFLTDDVHHLTKWRFPGIVLSPGEFLVVFASAKNRTNVTGRLHTNFKLNSDAGYLALVSSQTNVVSEFAPSYPPQYPDVSYGRAPGAPESLGYFTQPTPGAPNAASGPGFAPGVEFTSASGTFTSPFNLTLSAASTNAVIHYTLDGSLPTNSSPVYLAPIQVSNSIQVRARAFEDGLFPGPPRTETYILLNSDVVKFTSDLPVLIIHALGKGAPSDSRQNFAHIAVFEPADGITSLTNAPTLVTRSGIKIRGSSTDGLPKASYSVEFWDEFNQDAQHEILGLPAESDWVLYAPDMFEPVLIHNPFVHQLSRDMGRYSSRTRFVEVYLNKGTGPISASTYNGIYVLEEKIKIGPNRVAIDKLHPENIAYPEVTGGYLFKIDRLDPGDSGFSGAGQLIDYLDPKERDIKLPQRDPQEQYVKTYFANFGQALNGANWTDPTRGYASWIDVDSWIDYHLLEVLSGNVDALVLSTYFSKPRLGKIVFGPHWDFDRALGSTDGRDANPRNWTTGPFFTGWWSRLFRDPDFWQKWIDRYQELRGSLFSQAHINALVDRLADELRQAQPRERKRWGVVPRGGSYQAEVNLMKNWLSNREDFIDKQLVQPPAFSAPAGRVTPGFSLNLTGPLNSTVYYTDDGSDPRLAQGSVSFRAQIATGPITVNQNVRIVARARNFAQRQTGGPPISSSWSGPVAATFEVAPPPLLLTELMFHPEPPAQGSPYSASDFAFLELKNVSPASVGLAGYHFTNAISFTFTVNSAVTNLAPGERVLLVRNLAAFRLRYPGASNLVGEFSGGLASASNQLTLLGPLEEPIFDFTFQNSWQPLADGFGFSLVVASESLSPSQLGDPANWRLSANVGGSPGQADPLPPAVPHVVVNELLPNPGFLASDSLELFNPTSQRADISGWYLTDDFTKPKKFRLASGVTIEPNGYFWFKSFAATGATFSFSKLGEQVYLFSADQSGNLTGWYHGFAFGAAELGVSFGRYVNSVGTESFVAQASQTIGATNSGPRVGPAVISEIMFHPKGDGTNDNTADEYVELRNTSGQPVPLFDPAHSTNTWHLRGALDFDFPANTLLSANGFLVLVSFDPQTNPAALAEFRSRYGFEPGGRLLGPWHGHLNNSGETLRLLKPGEPDKTSSSSTATVPEILVEQVSYSAEAPWPSNANGTGLALVRRDAGAFADDPINWQAALPSPGDLDSDGDGLPDQWEIANGFDPHSALGDNGANGDPDHDGFTNLQEFLGGTDPRDGQSFIKLLIPIRLGNGVIQFPFQTVPGRSYTLEYRDALSRGPWLTLQSATSPADGSPASVADAPTNACRFYRLRTP